jgi:hypothetical protein
MRNIHGQLVSIVAATLLAACAGTPVSLGTRVAGPIPAGIERTITAEACGFQLLLFIPIQINNRAQRAYQVLEAQAGGDFITDVQVEESWTYAFVGTSYCTGLRAKAVRPKSS